VKNKLGKFVISNSILQNINAHEDLMRLMGRMIVVRAEQQYHIDGIEFIAMSEYFRELSQGEAAPEYKFTFDYGEIRCEAV